DNIMCRSIHVVLTLRRTANVKQVHCPHVGPTGGMKCVNELYNEGYFNDQALFGSPQGETFICPRKHH
ncbi:hypothetical protein DL98DRAFT_441620, partial [Cadophora sp. DSE1049]